jgi:hypothetical protein
MKPWNAARVGKIVAAIGWIWLAWCFLLRWLLAPELAPASLFDVLGVAGALVAQVISAGLRPASTEE